jgi:hypothetical protein
VYKNKNGHYVIRGKSHVKRYLKGMKGLKGMKFGSASMPSLLEVMGPANSSS